MTVQSDSRLFDRPEPVALLLVLLLATTWLPILLGG